MQSTRRGEPNRKNERSSLFWWQPSELPTKRRGCRKSPLDCFSLGPNKEIKPNRMGLQRPGSLWQPEQKESVFSWCPTHQSSSFARLFQTRSNQPRILWGGAVVDPFYQNKKEQLGVAIVQESRNGVLTKRTSLDRQSFRPPCRQARSFKRRKMPTCSSTCLLEMIRVHQNGQMHPLFDMSDDRRLFRNLVHQTHTRRYSLDSSIYI